MTSDLTRPAHPSAAMTSPATARNTGPILDILMRRLPAGGRVLEVASGAGEHAVAAARALPGLNWTPSDPAPEARASIAAWRHAAGLPNLSAPLAVDALDEATWPAGPFDAIVCINMVHISPWAATHGLMAFAGSRLQAGALLYLYGPYRQGGRPLAPSNAAFDESLKARDPAWGLREVAAVEAEAGQRGLVLIEQVAMPANNLSLIFRYAA